MRTEVAARWLEVVPQHIRTRLLEAHADGKLPPGATSVVARFFDELARRRGPLACPSRATFEAACDKEWRLGLLLRTLERHAPEMGLAEGRQAMRACYATRSRMTGVGRGGAQVRRTPGTGWPAEWQALLPGSLAAPRARELHPTVCRERGPLRRGALEPRRAGHAVLDPGIPARQGLRGAGPAPGNAGCLHRGPPLSRSARRGGPLPLCVMPSSRA